MRSRAFIDLTIPVAPGKLRSLKAGQEIRLSGDILTLRDSVHKRLAALHRRRKPLPINLSGAVIYYAGPAPTKPGYVIGPISPTTASRCDQDTPLILSLGVRAMIGKGDRSAEVIRAIKINKAVYFAATGGAAALYARCVTSARIVAFKELGPEAVMRLTVRRFPVIVAIDPRGNSLYEQGPKKFRKINTKEDM